MITNVREAKYLPKIISLVVNGLVYSNSIVPLAFICKATHSNGWYQK